MALLNPWTETAAILCIALLGIYVGKVFARFRSPYWLAGYFIPFLVIIFLIIGRFCNRLAYSSALCSVVAGRAKFGILAFVITMGLTTPISRLGRSFQRIMSAILMFIVVGWFCVLPFLTPALIKDSLLRLPTIVNAEGICFQSTDYTCAPAAAVTALGKLGFKADEGRLAVLSHTNPLFGTLPVCLRDTLEECFADEGLECHYRYFDSVDQLKDAPVTLAVVKDSFFSDHCVAVLEVSNGKVIFADPVIGKVSMSYRQFGKIWRFSGITLKISPSKSI